MQKIGVGLCVFWCFWLGATETDDYTSYMIQIRDSLPIMNEMTNGLLKKAAEEATKTGSCSDEGIRAQVWKTLGGNRWGAFEVQLQSNPLYDRFLPQTSDSVYKYASLTTGPVLKAVDLGASIQVGPYKFGTDKPGHFFAQGNELFKINFIQGKGIKGALKFSDDSENTFLGRLPTGVYSNGDKTANFNGMLFWAMITDQFLKDPVVQEFFPEAKPYFTCSAGKWSQVRTFDWLEYVDPAWNEATNCSDFGDKLKRAVQKRVGELEQIYTNFTKVPINLKCPIIPQGCAAAREKYGTFAPDLLHKDCLAAAQSKGGTP